MMKKLLRDTSGNVAVTAALIMLPLLLTAGAAVDYTSFSSKNSELQNAVDAAILAVGKEARFKDDAELKKIAKDFLKSSLEPEHYAQIESIVLEDFDDGRGYRLTANAAHDTSLMKLVGFDKLDYSPHAAIKLGGQKYEIVMVLDTTYSMSAAGKMDALKPIAKQFVEELTIFNTGEDRVKIGIVPFAKYVNVGKEHRNASWISVPPDTSENICQMQTPVISRSGCTTKTYYNDGVPYEAETCTSYTYGEPTEVCFESKKEWHGCVGSRPEPLNIEDRSYGTRVPGLQNVSCGPKLTPLTADKNKLVSAINALTPSGDTYIPAGLTWGLRVLTDHKPFTGGASSAEIASGDTRRVLILMSDGENVTSKSPGAPEHNGGNPAKGDKVTKDLCSEIRDNDTFVYTIAFGSDISPSTQQMLKKCSTEEANHFTATNTQGLAIAFEEISAKLAALYLSE